MEVEGAGKKGREFSTSFSKGLLTGLSSGRV